MQETNIKKGSVCVTDQSDVVLITRTNVQSDEPDSAGRIWIFHVGSVLRSRNLPVGSRWAGQVVRTACEIEDLLELADSQYDLVSPAQKPDSELSEIQLLQRKVAQLEQVLKQNQTPEVVQRPRTGIAALQPQKQ